jgi:hypothetical protein
MKHLVDAREPITTADIDQAIRDADELLERNAPIDERDLIERLSAIVAYAYGYEETSDGD